MTGDIRQLKENTDTFGNLIYNRTNLIDLASHYPYSPERWTLNVNGTRQLLQYGGVSQYNHAGDVHELTPAGGETVTLRSAERPRYVVAYELACTFAFGLNQELQGNDKLKVGLYDGTDGWYMEHNGGHEPDKADFVSVRDGTEVYRETNIDTITPLSSFDRLKLETGWYNVTRQRWIRSYSNDGEQVNSEIGKFSVDGQRGPKVGNLPLVFEITADASTTGLRLDAGSAAQVNLGKTNQFTRSKIDQQTATIGTTGSYVPLLALRTDPDREIINVQFTDLAINEFTGNADIQLRAQSFDPSNVLDVDGNTLTDANFGDPTGLDGTNNAIQTSTDVEQIPDSTGTTATSVADPGGWQLGHDALQTGGGNTVTSESPNIVKSKRPIYPRDIVVILANAGATGDVTYQYRTEQDW